MTDTPVIKHDIALPFHVVLKDFEGKIVKEMNLARPLPFAYVFYMDDLFVVSRDEPNVLLQRSYCIWVENPPLPENIN